MTVKPFVWSDVIVENLHSVQDRAVLCLEGTHDSLSVSDLTIEPFHLVVVMLARQSDVSNVDGAIDLLVSSVLPHVRIVI